MPIVFAHAGHFLYDLVIFGPVLAFAIWFAVITVRDRRRD
jgi:hypothetical protein